MIHNESLFLLINLDEVASSQLFECVCTLGKFMSVGLNQKKLNAKHVAAEKMLRILDEAKLIGRIKIPNSQFIDNNEVLGDNPVSRLYELLQMKGREIKNSIRCLPLSSFPWELILRIIIIRI